MAKLLLVDDDLDFVGMLGGRLNQQGHQIFAATDALSAMMVAVRENPDLIVMDYKMPAGDGSMMVTRLRGNNITARTPVIILTGLSSEELDPALSGAAGVRIHKKPLQFERLLAVIGELLADPFSAAA